MRHKIALFGMTLVGGTACTIAFSYGVPWEIVAPCAFGIGWFASMAERHMSRAEKEIDQ